MVVVGGEVAALIPRTVQYSYVHSIPMTYHKKEVSFLKLLEMVCLIATTTSNLATFGTSQSVLIRGVASFQGWICTEA